MKWRTYIALLVALGALAAVVYLVAADEPAARDDSSDAESGTVVASRPSGTATPGSRAEPGPTGVNPTGSSRTNAYPSANSDSTSDIRPSGQHQQPIERQTGDRNPATRSPDVESADMGADEDMRPWNDPVNRQVLGDKRWMAPVSDEERERIDEIFRKAREARHDPKLSRVDTLSSIDAATAIVDDCYEELTHRVPGMRGRLIVRWQSGADERNGWIRDPEILVNYKLGDPDFERCVVDRLDDAVFAAAPAEPRTIEHPFFYDGSF